MISLQELPPSLEPLPLHARCRAARRGGRERRGRAALRALARRLGCQLWRTPARRRGCELWPTAARRRGCELWRTAAWWRGDREPCGARGGAAGRVAEHRAVLVAVLARAGRERVGHSVGPGDVSPGPAAICRALPPCPWCRSARRGRSEARDPPGGDGRAAGLRGDRGRLRGALTAPPSRSRTLVCPPDGDHRCPDGDASRRGPWNRWERCQEGGGARVARGADAIDNQRGYRRHARPEQRQAGERADQDLAERSVSAPGVRMGRGSGVARSLGKRASVCHATSSALRWPVSSRPTGARLTSDQGPREERGRRCALWRGER